MKKPDYSWQGRCVDAILTAVSQGKRDFLVNATPGAGKTHMTATLAAHMTLMDIIDFVVVIVPTSTVRDHFIEDMAQEGITLARITDGEDFRRMETQGIGDKVQGFCMTTGMLALNATDIAALIEPYRVLHVSDEAHHNGTGLCWGDAAIEVSASAVLRLGLSGTPYRSDKREIPFLRYEERVGVPHFEFTFKQARDAAIITAIDFRTVTGHIDVLDTDVSDEPRRYSYDDDSLNEVDMTLRLNYSLHFRSHYLQALIAAADGELQLLRRTQPNAAGIVFANTRQQASTITRYLTHALGRSARLVIDDADGSEEVRAFNESDEEWIVQIRKVYEGANIPRLRVGVYVTNWVTEGFFDQASKRLVRRIDGIDPDDMPALMFMPADPRLEMIASDLGRVKSHDINKTTRLPFMDVEAGDDRDEVGHVSQFEILGGVGLLSGAIIDGRTFTAEDIAVAEDYFESIPEMRGQPSVTKMRIYAMLKRTGKL